MQLSNTRFYMPLRIVKAPRSPELAKNSNTRELVQLAQELREKHAELNSWPKASIACDVLTSDGRPDPALALRIATKSYEPRRQETRTRLGLAPIASVVLIGEGELPDGAQTIRAIQCSCGQWFIPNHPRRKHCFICRPYRRRNTPF